MTVSELRSAGRFLTRAPRTAAAAVVCIATGAAAVSAVASLVSAALLRPLPFPEPERLVRIWVDEEAGGDRSGLAVADVADLRELPAFDRVEGATRARRIFIGESGGRRVEGEGVSDGYFELLGARLARGRVFTPDEHATEAPVMLLTHEAWGRLFAYDEDAVGAAIRTAEAVYTVVGVLDESFTGTIEDDSGDIEFFVPSAAGLASGGSRAVGNVWAIGRIAAGQSMVRAQANVDELGARLAAEHGERAGTSLRVEAMSENWRGGLRQGLWLLLGAAALLLIVAASNVGGLMLARGLSRRRELAVRSALGASRGRTVGLLAIEAIVAAVLGGVIGILLGPVLLRLFARVSAVPVPEYVALEPDGMAIAMTLAILGATSVIAAVIPAFASAGIQPQEVIRGSGRGTSLGRGERRTGQALIIGQVALATVLVASAALLLRSYQSLHGADLGFRTEAMLRVALFVNPLDAPELSDVVTLQDRALQAVAGLPGVVSVGRVWPTAPLVSAPQTAIRYPGMDERRAETGENVAFYAADEGFFHVLEIPVLAGRGIDRGDHADAEPVAVVSASLARRLGGPEDALGAAVSVLGTERRVVGVIADAHLTGPRAPLYEHTQLFLPLAQLPNRLVSFAIRTADEDPASALPVVRRALAALAPASALDWTEPFPEALGTAFERDRFMVALTGAFSAATVALAGIGLLALLAFTVARGRFEIGLRQALGATRSRIVASVVGRAVGLVGAGLVLGFVFSALVGELLAGLLYDVGTLDPIALAATAAVLLGGALIASVAPARSAARIPPATALRQGE